MKMTIQTALGQERFNGLLKLVRAEARRIISTMPLGAIEIEELSGYGFIGLMDAWQRFDASKEIKFETFARHRVRGAMLDGLRTTLGLARRRGYQRLKDQIIAWQVADAAPSYPSERGRAGEADVSFRQITELAQSFLKQDIETARSPLADDILESSERTQRLRRAVDQLEANEREVIVAVYDLTENGDSGARLAARRGINRSGICRRHKSILKKLRSTLIEGGTLD